MSKFTTAVLVTFAFLSGILFQMVYVSLNTESTSTSKHLKYKGYATNITESIPLYCSGSEPCEARLNNGKIVPLRLFGEFDKTWITVGDKTIESSAFYQHVYQGKYPEGVATIDFKY